MCIRRVLPVVLALSGWSVPLAAHGQADRAIQRGIAFLRQTQRADGSWSPKPGPAITALVVTGMLESGPGADDMAINRAIDYILSKCRADGGMHDQFLQTYNTAICLSALARAHHRADAAAVIPAAQDYLRRLQWAGQRDVQGRLIDRTHPFWGGAGYGTHGRPDLSNTQLMLQGLYDSKLSHDDVAFQRALVFISRCQASSANDMFAAQIEPDGGFIYSTSVSRDLVGVPQSMASPDLIDEARTTGRVSGLRTYGSMTYAGFKSYLYADLAKDDHRVLDAYGWIRGHYTLQQNPGMPDGQQMEGYYYYLMTLARALRAYGDQHVRTADGTHHDWADDLIDQLVRLQRADGAWVNSAERWLEDDPNLVTAYALIALTSAVR